MSAPLAAGEVPFGPEQRALLASEGFVVLPGLITPAGLDLLNRATDEHLAAGGAGATAAWLWPGSLGEALWRVATEPGVVGLMRELCGPNVCLWAGGLAAKPAMQEGADAADQTIPWHQVRLGAWRRSLNETAAPDARCARRTPRTGTSTPSGTASSGSHWRRPPRRTAP
jgi:hypothetical protein